MIFFKKQIFSLQIFSPTPGYKEWILRNSREEEEVTGRKRKKKAETFDSSFLGVCTMFPIPTI